MTWKHRSGSSWSAPTPKVREGGQWVTLGGGDGGGGGGSGGSTDVPARMHDSGPGTRDGTTVSYPSDGHSSLQNAYNSLNSGDTLFIEAGNYTEKLKFNQNTVSNITIEGEGTLGDTVLTHPGSPTISFGMSRSEVSMNTSADTYLDGTHSGASDWDNLGASSITVNDASSFSVGEDIRIYDPSNPYSHYDKVYNTFYGQEVRTVENISGNTLELDYPLFLRFPDGAEVCDLSWVQTDVCVRNLVFDLDSNSRGLLVWYQKHLWLENLLFKNASYGSNSGKAIGIYGSYEGRAHNIEFDQCRRYGITVAQEGSRICCTDITHDTTVGWGARYAVRSGNEACDVYAKNLYTAVPGGGPSCNTHYGGWWAQFHNVTADGKNGNPDSGDAGTKGFRARSHNLTVTNLTHDGNEADTFVLRQAPHDVHISGVDVVNKQGGTIFGLYLDDTSGGDTGEFGRRVTYEDITIEDYGPAITDIGSFGDPMDLDELTFRNVTYGGQSLTRSDVEAWSGYDSTEITNLTVE